MKESTIVLIVLYFASFDPAAAVVYESTGEPCPLPDLSLTDLSINCPSQVINIPDNGTITAFRIGLFIEHPSTWDLGVALLSPHRYWNGTSTGSWRQQVWALNVQSRTSLRDTRTPAMIYGNTGQGDRIYSNLGSSATNEPLYITALADPYYGYDAVYWMAPQNRNNVTGMFGGSQFAGGNAWDLKIASFIGESTAGDWSLVIADIEAGDSGTLIKWLIEIKYCGDGEVTWPEECETGNNNCTSECKCESGTRPDPNSPGVCLAIACGDGIAMSPEECDGGFGCNLNCTCQQGWIANEAPSPSCQLIGKQYKTTLGGAFFSGGVERMTNITIDDRGAIQSIKFGILIKHTFVSEVYLWLVLPNGTFPLGMPGSFESTVVRTDPEPTIIKLIGSYGSYFGLDNIGNITTGRPLWIGSNVDPNFSAPRLDTLFITIEGGRASPERLQANKIASLLGQELQGTYQIIGGDYADNADKGTLTEFIIEALCNHDFAGYNYVTDLNPIVCGDGIYNPWHEQCDTTRGCNNETCTCMSEYRNVTGKCVLLTCNNGVVESGEECDSSEYCEDCVCTSGSVSNGTFCVVPVDTVITPQPNDERLIGGIIGGVGGGLVVTAVVLIVLAKKGKLKKKKGNELRDVADDSIYIAMRGVTIDSNGAIIDAINTDDRMSIPYSQLVFKHEIGAGGFGKVFVGEWQRTKVAIKIATYASAEDFTREAKLSVYLRPHPNVVQTLGVSVDGQFPALVLEYCAGGSLDKALYNPVKQMTYLDKLCIMTGIAKGMLHLHNNNIVHRDLAARNILLSEIGEPKISDFGMSRLVHDDGGNTTKTSVGPLKWMAPESIRNREYSKKTDLWSFGVVVWEIVARAEPYKGEDLMDLGLKIRDEGHSLAIPDNTEPLFKHIMTSCFQKDPQDRLDADVICNELDKELEQFERAGDAQAAFKITPTTTDDALPDSNTKLLDG